jgi:hypothetical protein
VKGLMQITNQVHEELERDRPVGAIQRGIRQPFLVINDPVHNAVTPPVTPTTGGNPWLPWTVAVTVIIHRIERNVDVVPEGRLIVAF